MSRRPIRIPNAALSRGRKMTPWYIWMRSISPPRAIIIPTTVPIIPSMSAACRLSVPAPRLCLGNTRSDCHIPAGPGGSLSDLLSTLVGLLRLPSSPCGSRLGLGRSPHGLLPSANPVEGPFYPVTAALHPFAAPRDLSGFPFGLPEYPVLAPSVYGTSPYRPQTHPIASTRMWPRLPSLSKESN